MSDFEAIHIVRKRARDELIADLEIVMKLVRLFFRALFTIFPVCMLSLNGAAQDFEIRLIENSKTLSQAVAINANLDVIGTREVTEGPITSFRGFFRRGDVENDLGPPKTYSNLEPCALIVPSALTKACSALFGIARLKRWCCSCP